MIISFDLDGTLFDMDFEETLWREEIPKLYAEKHKISFEDAKKIVFSAYSEIDDEDLRWYDIDYWLKKFELGKPWEEIVKDLKHKVRMYPEAKPVLEELKRKYPLIVVSNAPHKFIKVKIEVESVHKYFKKIYSVTSDFKMVKKHGNVYQKVCEDLKISPEEMIHIGDHYKFDYEVPKHIGIKSFYLDRKKEKKGNDIVHSLEEFKEKIIQEFS